MSESGSTRCPRCGGSGWVMAERDGRGVAARCACRRDQAREALLRAARIPPRFACCTLDGFDTSWNPGDPSLRSALQRTREFVDGFAAATRGLLFMGNAGTGKTHLAVAALTEIVTTRSAHGLYVNFTELVLELQMSIEGAGRSRDEILPPIVDADLVVLDELGAAKPTPWVMDLMYYIVNARYMAQRPLLVTTNFRDAAREPGGGESRLRAQESLSDRISPPVRSRLYEMCDLVFLAGDDYRHSVIAQRGRR